MISITSLEFEIKKKDILYFYQVRCGNAQAWVIAKQYEEFEALHDEMQRMYGMASVPYLTGKVAPWKVGSRSVGLERLPKLEKYLCECLADADRWEPIGYVVQLPNPDDATKAPLELNKFLFDFLQFSEHFHPPSSTSATPSPQQQTTGPSLAAIHHEDPTANPNAANEVYYIDADGVLISDHPSDHALHPEMTETELYYEKTLTGESEEGKQAHDGTKDPEGNNKKKNDDDDKGEVPLENQVTYANVMNDCACITTQIQACITEHTILPKSHIEYQLSVGMSGHHWLVTKRFTDFKELDNQLRMIYFQHTPSGCTTGGAATAPAAAVHNSTNTKQMNKSSSIQNFTAAANLCPPPQQIPDLSEASDVPAWRKLDESTAIFRQVELTKYLQLVIHHIDDWEPKGLVVNFQVDAATKTGSSGDNNNTSPFFFESTSNSVNVAVNKVIFDFLDFSSRIGQFRADAAVEEIEKRKMFLPQAAKEVIERKRKVTEQLQVAAVFALRRKRFKILTDEKVKELMDLMLKLDDDRDVFNVVEYFCMTGEIEEDVQRLANEKEKRIAAMQKEAMLAGQMSMMQQQTGGGGGNYNLAGGRSYRQRGVTIASSRTGGFSALHSSPQSSPPISPRGDRQQKLQSTASSEKLGGGGVISPRRKDGNNDEGKLSPMKRNVNSSDSNIPSSATTHSNNKTKSAVGVTSEQTIQIAKAVYFNDVRSDVIRKVAETVLLDSIHLSTLMETLDYEWETVEKDVFTLIRSNEGLGVELPPSQQR